MPLVLITLVSFAAVGLGSRRFGGRQQLAVAVIAAGLALIQLALPRYL